MAREGGEVMAPIEEMLLCVLRVPPPPPPVPAPAAASSTARENTGREPMLSLGSSLFASGPAPIAAPAPVTPIADTGVLLGARER